MFEEVMPRHNSLVLIFVSFAFRKLVDTNIRIQAKFIISSEQNRTASIRLHSFTDKYDRPFSILSYSVMCGDISILDIRQTKCMIERGKNAKERRKTETDDLY